MEIFEIVCNDALYVLRESKIRLAIFVKIERN